MIERLVDESQKMRLHIKAKTKAIKQVKQKQGSFAPSKKQDKVNIANHSVHLGRKSVAYAT